MGDAHTEAAEGADVDSSHWSRVAHGSKFFVVLLFDPEVFTKDEVRVPFVRAASGPAVICSHVLYGFTSVDGGHALYHVVKRCKKHLTPLRLTSSNPKARVQAVRPNEIAGDITCKICMQKVAPAFMRNHMGAHLLPGVAWGHGLIRPREPCGICGIRSSYGQQMADASVIEGCPVSLSKSSGSMRAVHQCKLAGSVSYSLLSATKSTLSGPCTNHPVQCPSCPLIIWSQNASAHFAWKHPTHALPPSLAASAALGVHEAEWLATLIGRKAVP